MGGGGGTELLSPLYRMPFPFSMAVFTLETDDTRDGKTDG